MYLNLLLGTLCGVFSVIIVILVKIILNLLETFSKERNDLINRLMAKNNNEYMRLKNNEEKLTKEEILGDDLRGDIYDPLVNGVIN